MAKGDLIRNAVEAMIVVGKDVVPAGNLLFEVGKWLFDKYKEHQVNKRLEDLEEGAKIKPQEAVQIAREEIEYQRQNGRVISGEFERQLIDRAAMMPAMVNQHIRATLQQAQRHGTQAVDALPIGDHIRENERTAFYQSLIPPRAPQFHKGDKLPHYNPQWKLVEMLGSGGFGEVWQVEHTISKKSFAVKFCLDEQSAKLLKREANALMELSQKLPDHPNIVDLKDIQLEEQPYWLMFEQINGGTLHSLMQAKQLTVQESLDLFVPIVEAMALVHQAGIIHRDLKPANILLTAQNIPKIADFGIGKIMAEQTASTQQTKSLFTAMGYGTPDYMSPEQMMSFPAHFSDDVYSLGVIFWQMLSHTLQAPHYLRNSLKKLSISDEMKNILLSCIEEPRDERIQNARELLQQLRTSSPSRTASPEQPTKPIQTPVQIIQPPNLTGFENLSSLREESFSFEVVTVKGIESKWLGLSKEVITESTKKQTKQLIFDLEKGIKLEMVSIPTGSFKMGSNQYDSEKPIHEVKIEKAFYMGKYPVTQAQYQQIMGNNPSNFKGEKRPVETVCWNDAAEFCKKLSQKLGIKFRLPTEAEWEYACRGGTTTPFHFGETIASNLINYNGSYSFRDALKGEWERRPQTVEVDYFKHANNFGLYQMHGNVWEWCEDDWEGNYQTPRTQATHKKSNKNKLLRGGSWFNFASYCRSAARYDYTPDKRNDNIGFRVVSVFSL